MSVSYVPIKKQIINSQLLKIFDLTCSQLTHILFEISKNKNGLQYQVIQDTKLKLADYMKLL